MSWAQIVGRFLAVALPLTLITYGTYKIYPPAAYIVLGVLMWLDLSMKRND